MGLAGGCWDVPEMAALPYWAALLSCASARVHSTMLHHALSPSDRVVPVPIPDIFCRSACATSPSSSAAAPSRLPPPPRSCVSLPPSMAHPCSLSRRSSSCSESKTLGEFSEVDPKGGVDSIKRNREEMETRTQTALAGSLTREFLLVSEYGSMYGKA